MYTYLRPLLWYLAVLVGIAGVVSLGAGHPRYGWPLVVAAGALGASIPLSARVVSLAASAQAFLLAIDLRVLAASDREHVVVPFLGHLTVLFGSVLVLRRRFSGRVLPFWRTRSGSLRCLSTRLGCASERPVWPPLGRETNHSTGREYSSLPFPSASWGPLSRP
ncbi:MAG: hypothetical protein A07HR67_00057 [uncultured archaeon A07HR67]|nr:MAG: hypothetical protein A07HR67_00057 [uncultured archaeon A07HR67]